MRKIILDYPKQFRIGIETAKNIFLKPGTFIRWPENIIICGMGGSALPGDILVTLRPLDVFCHKSYGLPPQAGNESLIICISYSGNTEETLSSFNEALKRKLPLISITSGGELAKLSKKNGIPLAIIPHLFSPRLALGIQFAVLLRILSNQGILSKEIIKEILEIGKKLKSGKFENQGKKIAKKIKNRIPIIYSSYKQRVLAQIWKINLNENAKIPAFYNCFPELNHNEITGFENLQGFQLSYRPSKAPLFHTIILRDPSDHPRILKRIRLTTKIIKERRVGVDIINLKGKNILEKIFSNIILAEWTSYYLALEYKVDPTPVKLQEKFKLWLKSKK